MKEEIEITLEPLRKPYLKLIKTRPILAPQVLVIIK
jgi:hypothetical protein